MEAKPGDLVKIITNTNEAFEGILMPQEKKSVVIKIKSGYNIGIDREKVNEIKIISKAGKEEKAKEEKKNNKQEENKKQSRTKGLPLISILHTGGTIASRVDYRTGAVHAEFSPEDLLEMFPELKEITNIQSKLVFQMFSEDYEPEHWSILAEEIKKEIDNGVDGIIVTHGTDTMHYTAAALSFMLENLNVPVILVGAQRSSDRGSSDAAINLISASLFIAKTEFAGVAVCMHENTNDDSCLILPGLKVRKMHTSRRDAFRAINSKPIAKVNYKLKLVEFITQKYNKKSDKKTILRTGFEKNIAIIKARPGLNYKEIEFYKDYKGIIFEGTGLGHLGVSVLDKYTHEHKKTLETIKELSKKIPVFMCSQCINGRINMNVYSTGRDLQEQGVIPLEDMTSEAAYVKLGWLLAHNKDINEVKKLMKENIAGEISERTEFYDSYNFEK